MTPILKVENISKQYRLGVVSSGTLGHDLNRFWHKVRGKEDPYLQVGAQNVRSSEASEDYVWALKNINFEVMPGEVFGIIGKNGAGKSTLLKLLSRVTGPTTGEIKSRGRIASLLEVGTGFHPELTGRENIFLNGAILGMTKAEINSKLDEIIAFSGCEMYIDTPTKRYSSGMTVRLAFAVAAHLEPDILVVDEVLAVGDAEFQRKAIGKMQDISTADGRTVLFVSHNMGSIKSLCTRAMILENGLVKYDGTTEEAVSLYLEGSREHEGVSLQNRTDRIGKGDVRFTSIEFLDKQGKTILSPLSGDYLCMRLGYFAKREVKQAVVGVAFFNQAGVRMTAVLSDDQGQTFHFEEKEGAVELHFDRLHLYSGTYYLNLVLADSNTKGDNMLDKIENAAKLEVLPGDFWSVGKNNRTLNTPVIQCSFKVVD